MKKCTEVLKSEIQRGPHVASGDVDNNQDKAIEDPDQPSFTLLSKLS